MTRSVESVLAEIPGWEGARYSALGGGQTSRTWLVETDDRKAVLKIDDAPRAAPYNTRPSEARIQTHAAANGLANPVLVATDTVYMTEYLEGAVWTRTDLDDDDKLARLGNSLRRLHSLPLTGRTFDAKAAAKVYAAGIENADENLLQQELEIIDAMPAPHRPCCCHNDLVAENIIATPAIHFLDWEYACDNDPLFDLATLVAHHELPAERRDTLLDAYFEGDAQRWIERLVMYERFYAAILWLWQASR